MNKTTTLEIIQNLRKEGLDLMNLSESEVIRIEKTLKAKIKLDQSLDINELEAVVHLLRTQSKSLELFFHADFNPLRKILQGKDFVILSANALNKIKAEGEKLKPFLSTYFFEELIHYARKCLDEHHYRALYEFLNLRFLLDEKVLDVIRTQIEQRFMLLSETFLLHASKKSDKIFPLMNPYFYRCINELNRDAVFENRVMIFQDDIIHKQYDIPKNVFIRLIFSLTYYIPLEESNKEIILQNHRYSADQGAYEVRKKNEKLNFKGDSEIKKAKTSFNFDFINLIRLIIPLMIVVYYFNNSGSTSSRNYNYSRSVYDSEELTQQIQKFKHIQESKNRIKNDGKNNLYNDYLPNAATIQFLQFEDVDIIEKKPVSVFRIYDFKTSPIQDYNRDNRNDFLELRNTMPNDVILILQNQKSDSTYLHLQPFQSKKINFELAKLTIYSGEDLQEVEYLDKNDSIRYGLRYNKFRTSHENAYREIFTFKNINKNKFHSVRFLAEKDYKTKIEIKHKVSDFPNR